MARTWQMVVVRPSANLRTQSGVVLLLIVLGILGLGAGMLLLAINTANSERSQRKFVSGSQALAAGKQALIGYAIGSLTGTGARPGWLPLPDTLANTNYNGQSDATSCLNGAATNGMPALSGVDAQVATLRCLGRLPWNTLGLSIDGASEQDLLGLVPWYAVSPNLADPNAGTGQCMTVLNPTTAMATAPGTFVCGTTSTPAWPWLKVCDNTGRILSDRVAAVLILPGEAINTTGRTQLRTNAATIANPNGYGFPADFLDAVPTPAGWSSIPVAQRCTTFDNAALSGEFIAADASVVFNDQLIYITVDELMVEAEKRVAIEVREAMFTLRQITGMLDYSGLAFVGSLPWLAPIGNPSDPVNAFVATTNARAGLIPFHVGGAQFLTELSWSITGADTLSPASSASPTFTCTVSGVVRQCRIRQDAATPITRTVTPSDMAAYKTYSLTAPSVTCSWNTTLPDQKLDCTSYTVFTQANPTSYFVEHRPCCAGGWTSFGDVSGTTTRTVTLTVGVTDGATRFANGSSSTHLRRRIFPSATGGVVEISIADRWNPSGGTIVATATLPPTGTGSAQNTAAGPPSGDYVSDIRRYPVLPAWYLSQNWYQHIYGAISADVAPPALATVSCTANCFTSGGRNNIDAVFISTGAALAGQIRYSGTPAAADFLESANATGGTTGIFSPPTQLRTSIYSDSVVTLPR
ncbi:MAG: hypothetical protein ING75_07260 [Rhodocyclaceae bacterium]|nr:hypothetical protein [Rhodocyclaceae bacterium]